MLMTEHLLFTEGLKFFRSANNVILSPGDQNGYIHPRYFSCVFQRGVNGQEGNNTKSTIIDRNVFSLSFFPIYCLLSFMSQKFHAFNSNLEAIYGLIYFWVLAPKHAIFKVFKRYFSDNLQIHLPRSDHELHGCMNNFSQRWILVFQKATCLGTAWDWELLEIGNCLDARRTIKWLCILSKSLFMTGMVVPYCLQGGL